MTVRKEDVDKGVQAIVRDNHGVVIRVVDLQDRLIGTSGLPRDLQIWGDLDLKGSGSVSGSFHVEGPSTLAMTFITGSLVVSGSALASSLTGSLTRLATGETYISSVSNQLTVTSASSGQVQLGTTMITLGLSSDFSTTSTSPQSSSFTFQVGANEVWDIEFDGSFGCSTTNGVQIGWAVPSGASAISRLFGATANAGTFSSTVSNTVNGLITTMTYSTVSGLAARMGRAAAQIRMGSSGGTVTMLMGVVTSGTARMFSGSFFRATRVTSV